MTGPEDILTYSLHLYNEYHKDPNEHKESDEGMQDSMDGMFRFEKRMKQNI